MPSVDSHQRRAAYWRSLAELAGTPEFDRLLEDRFPDATDPGGMSRRRWLQLMGASLALAGASGCRWQREEILPFAVRPPNRIPGQTERYATTMDLDGSAIGLLVTSIDGRPIKIEGNPRHGQSAGATHALAQAAILQLYDPDRSGQVYQRTGQGEIGRTWDEFAEFARDHMSGLSEKAGAGFRVLAGSSSSPTLLAMRARLLEAFPQAKWYEFQPISRDNQRAGSKLAFGKPYRTLLQLQAARVIVCLDADLLHTHPAAVQYARQFAKGREVIDAEISRLYAVESCFSLTGAAADHRLPLRSGQIAAFAAALEREVHLRLAHTRPQGTNDQPPAGRCGESSRVAAFVRAVAGDLVGNQGRSVVAAGPGQPAEVHLAVHRLNGALNNVGRTVFYTADPQPDRPSHAEAIRSLAAEINAGKVQTLLSLGGNPVYDAPADLGLAELLEKVPTRIHLSLYRDETSRCCTWHLPEAHFLESWGDARAYDGTYSIVQPLIEPLRGGKSAIEVLAVLLGQQQAQAEQLVRDTFRQIAGPQGFEDRWRRALHDGLLAESRWPAESPKLLSSWSDRGPSADLPEPQWSGGPLEIVFCQDASVYDGRFGNNGWLQELPDPMTRLTWDNAALLSPATAKVLGVANETLVRLKYRGREVEMPAYVMPGQAAGSVAVFLGYGRTAAGHVGGSVADEVQPVGVDVYRLRTSQAMDFDTGLTLQPTGKRYPLAVTQEHYAIDAVGAGERAQRLGALVREATLDHYRQHPDFAQHAVGHPPLESLWQEHRFEGHRWAMAIDLSKCIGCNACVVACQAENNVPIVGKQQVLRGREMHWIRVDRYFQGDPEDPAVAFQTVLCQQCELAPCEQVCPVAATSHSKEGLNDMAYNRCVGTRYCANNCPYKVRRFNFFNYHKDLDDPDHEILKMMYNPEVTVRSRGVMEKCTYCVQRIQRAKIAAKNGRRPIADGQLQTACQQVCPTQAIVFGDLSDPASQVARAHAADRTYAMLEELNVKPRTKYLARIRNPHPELEDAEHGRDRHAG